MVLGSEGRLGIISEATVHVRRIPEKRVILGYLFPNFRRRSRRDAGDRRRASISVSVTRVSDANETPVLVRYAGHADAHRQAAVARAEAVPQARQGLRAGRDVPRRSSATRAASDHVYAQRRAVGQDRQASWWAVHRVGPGRALRPEEVRHSLHPRLPARPRRARRRVGDRHALERAAAAIRRGDRGGERRIRPAGGQGLHHVPPVTQLPRRRVPVLHLCVRRRRTTRWPPSTRWSSRRSSRRSWTTAPRCRITTRSAPSMRSGSSRTSRRRGW